MKFWVSVILKIAIFMLLTFLFTILLGGPWQVLPVPQEINIAQLSPGIAAIIMVFLYKEKSIEHFPNDINKP